MARSNPPASASGTPLEAASTSAAAAEPTVGGERRSRRSCVRYVHGPIEYYREDTGHLRIGDQLVVPADVAEALVAGGQFERVTGGD